MDDFGFVIVCFQLTQISILMLILGALKKL